MSLAASTTSHLARRLRDGRCPEPRGPVRPRRRQAARVVVHYPVVARVGRRAGRRRRVDDAFVRLYARGIGAEIMGAGKFGPPGWHKDPEWKGWWGPNPPFHTPMFVLTHHTRPSIEMEGGTTFHFIDAPPAEALETAREAAGGQDIRIGGGPTVIRDFLAPAHRPHAHRRSPDPAGPRRTPLGRTRGPREAVPNRGHVLAERSHTCDVHSRGRLNRLRRRPPSSGALARALDVDLSSAPAPPLHRRRHCGRSTP